MSDDTAYMKYAISDPNFQVVSTSQACVRTDKSQEISNYVRRSCVAICHAVIEDSATSARDVPSHANSIKISGNPLPDLLRLDTLIENHWVKVV